MRCARTGYYRASRGMREIYREISGQADFCTCLPRRTKCERMPRDCVRYEEVFAPTTALFHAIRIIISSYEKFLFYFATGNVRYRLA